MGIFAEWQPVYAKHGVATFPVNIDDNGKRPAVRGYLKAGKQTSSAWATKFIDSNALGFAVRPNGITILDVDTPDENVLTDVMDRHGCSPLIVRSQSGNWQAYYRHNGETRQIRPWQDCPIDVLGDGFTVAPPSKGGNGRYQIVQGSLDDLSDLPVLHDLTEHINNTARPSAQEKTVTEGKRANDLFVYAMKVAHDCDSEAELLDKALTYAASTFRPELPDVEIKRGVASAWQYTIDGKNYLGERHVVLTHAEIDALASTAPDAFVLFIILRRNHWGGRSFRIANAMSDHGVVPFNRKRLSAARAHLLQKQFIDEIRQPSSKNGPALYTWAA